MTLQYLSPYIPIVYSKTGIYMVYLFLSYLVQNLDHVYSLEAPRRVCSNMYPRSMFWAQIFIKKSLSSQLLKLKKSLDVE